jgi:hypothetical protein
MFKFLKKKFTTVSRAAQMNVWNKFMTFRLSDHPSSAGLASKLRDLATEWKALQVELDEDTFLAFVLQASVTPHSSLCLDFERRVELEVQQDLGNKAPTFNRMIHLLEICQQQEELSNGKSKSAALSLQQQPSIVMEASTNQPADLQPFDQQAFLAGVPKSQWGEALQFYAVTANHCFACGKDNHYMRDCPTRARGIPLNRQQRGPGNFSLRPNAQPSPAQFYPIVGAMYPPPGLTFSQQPFPQHSFQQPPPHQSAQQFPYSPQPYNFQSPPFQRHQPGAGMLPPQQHLRPADNYRPNYSQHQPRSQASTNSNASRLTGGASVRQAEVDGLIDGLSSVDFQSMEASFGDVSVSAIIDSGATHNLTGNLSCLHNFRQLKKPIPLNVATRGSGAYISGIGELRFRVPSGRTVTLNHVFYCEQARSTLISLAALRKSNFLFHYDVGRDSFEIFDADKVHLFSCVLERARNRWCIPFPMISRTVQPSSITPSTESFPFSASQLSLDKSSSVSFPLSSVSSRVSPIPSCNSSSLQPYDPFVTPFERIYPSTWNPETLTKEEKTLLFWHRLFGHASLRKIQLMVKRQIGIGLPATLPPGQIHCPVCAIAKSTSLNPVSSSMRKSGRLEILCTDLMGPFPVETPCGSTYLLTLRDVASGYSYSQLLKKKDEANSVLIEIITTLEKQTGCQVKILRSDNGGEFANKVLGNFLTGKGIIAERLLPYHHYQNGVIERFNRTIADMGRTVLRDSKLPRSFWGFAFIWANHILNWIPNKTSGDRTPFEALFQRVPIFDGFRVFGSKAYIHVPVEKRRKLDDRAIEAVVVGHLVPSKGWLFWIPTENKFTSSSMVRFVDSLSPGSLIKQVTPRSSDLPNQETQPLTVPEEANTRKVLSDWPVKKMSSAFIANCLELGDFRLEEEFGRQELLVDTIVETCTFFGVDIPRTYKQAMKSSESTKWTAAILEELGNLKSMEVWTPAPLPPDKMALDGRWVFARKTNSSGEPDRFKARYVAKGFKQIAGQNFGETFAPTATFVSLRLLLTVAAHNHCKRGCIGYNPPR